MIQELMLASQSVQALGSLLKTASTLANYNEIVAAVAEVNSKLMQANTVALGSQEKQAELAMKILSLEAEIRANQKWEEEAGRYKLHLLAPGVVAYTLKIGMENGDPPHYLCANCMSKHQRSFLQVASEGEYSRSYICHNCSAQLRISTGTPPPPTSGDYDPFSGPGGWMSR